MHGRGKKKAGRSVPGGEATVLVNGTEMVVKQDPHHRNRLRIEVETDDHNDIRIFQGRPPKRD